MTSINKRTLLSTNWIFDDKFVHQSDDLPTGWSMGGLKSDLDINIISEILPKRRLAKGAFFSTQRVEQRPEP